MSAASSSQSATRKLLRALLDESGEGILALDENGTVIEANESAALRLGRSRRHLIGKPFAALVPVEQRRAFRSAFHAVEATTPAYLELTLGEVAQPAAVALRALPRVSPRTVVVRLLAAEIEDVQQQQQRQQQRMPLGPFFRRFPYGVIGIGSDLRVTFANPRAHGLLGEDVLQPGEPIARRAGDLCEVVARLARTRAPIAAMRVELPDGRIARVTGIPMFQDEPALLLLEDVTRQEEQARVTREFVRNAAHQLRTPLTALGTSVEILQAGGKDDPDTRDRFLAHMERHVARMTRLSRGLLTLARAQSREQPLRLDFVELVPLLERLAAEAEPAPGVEVEVRAAPGLAALAEPDLLEEALAALVENALAHTHEGSVRLSAAEIGRRAVITVADSGSGVLPEHRARIFEPFYRVAPNGGGGVGLGLAIAAQALEAMDGELVAEGLPGEGAAFVLRLPAGTVLR